MFEALLGADDTVIFDTRSLASTIDGIGPCAARRLRYRINDMMVDACDVVLELTRAATAFRHTIEERNSGGKIAIPGVDPAAFETHWSMVVFEMFNLEGVCGREMYETWHSMITSLQGGYDLSGVIVHPAKTTDVRDGMKAMRTRSCGSVNQDWT